MYDETGQALPISRLSFRPYRYDGVLLNGQPLSKYFRTETEPKHLDHLIFSVPACFDEHRALVLDCLNRLEGWAPILIDSYFRTLSDSAVVFAWVEERDGLVVWSRFVFGRCGESGPVDGVPVEVAPLAFDRDEYLKFIKEATGLTMAEQLCDELYSEPSEGFDSAADLTKHEPEVIFNFLARLIYDSGEGLWYRRNEIFERFFIAAVLIICGLSGALVFIYEATETINLFLALALAAALVAAAKMGFFANLYVRYLSSDVYDPTPSVYLTDEGLLPWHSRKLVSWGVFKGCQPDMNKAAVPFTSIKSFIGIARNGRIIFIPGTLLANGQINPDLSLINARLAALIKKHG